MKNKRKYSKPELELIEIDTEISILMMTDPPGDPESKSAHQDRKDQDEKRDVFNSPFE